MVDFKSLLAMPLDSIEAPKALPAGTYTGRVLRREFGESSQKKTPYVRFHLGVTGSVDVDPAELAGVDLSKKSLRRDFYLTTDAAYRLKAFLNSCGLKGMSTAQAIEEVAGQDVTFAVTQRQAKTGDDVFNDVEEIKGSA